VLHMNGFISVDARPWQNPRCSPILLPSLSSSPHCRRPHGRHDGGGGSERTEGGASSQAGGADESDRTRTKTTSVAVRNGARSRAVQMQVTSQERLLLDGEEAPCELLLASFCCVSTRIRKFIFRAPFRFRI
jgi:hypothetical protein